MPAPAISESAILDGLVAGSWAGGSALVLTYSIPTAGSAWTAYGAGEEPSNASYAVLSAGQAASFRTAMELYDSYVAAAFNETNDVTNPGAIRIAFTDMNDVGTWGYAYLPGANTNPNSVGLDGDIWLNTENVALNATFDLGEYDFNALLHEIGHALGLGHTFEGSPPIPVQFDNYRYSIMSYTEHADQYARGFEATGGGGLQAIYEIGGQPITPMIFDIFAVQSLYGVDTTTRATNTSYTFDPGFANLQTIWDAGGTDTWDLTGHVRRSIIDLREASFSSIDLYSVAAQIEAAVAQFGDGFRAYITSWIDRPDTFTWTNNVAIAYGTIIENVFCGDANDIVIGNSAANDLRGNGGSDTLNGAAGADKRNGGAGNDNMIGGTGNDTYTVNTAGDVTTETSAAGGVDLVKSSVTRTLGANLENLILTGSIAISGAGNSLANVLTGNSGANTLNGGSGNDTLKGGLGLDTLVGGNGADKFVFNTAPATANRDTITDYNVAVDTIQLDDAVFTALGAAGVLAASKFHIGASAHDADDRIVYNSATGALYYDANGSDAGGSIQFATLSAGLLLTAADFVVI